jgi:hypothetical protein
MLARLFLPHYQPALLPLLQVEFLHGLVDGGLVVAGVYNAQAFDASAGVDLCQALYQSDANCLSAARLLQEQVDARRADTMREIATARVVPEIGQSGKGERRVRTAHLPAHHTTR